MDPGQLPQQLPEIRVEITIRHGGSDFNNTPTWILHDPHSNRFFHIGWLEYEMLKCWHLQTSKALLQAINAETTLTVTEQDLADFITFLSKNYLIKHGFEGLKNIDAAAQDSTAGKRIFWLFKNYLFFRIPLCKPDNFLARTLPYVNWLFARRTVQLMALLGVIAIILVIREWDTFTSTLMETTRWQGFLYLLVGIFFTKVIHELGHAYICKKQGVKVPTMGIAFLVMWPVLYTDTSDSWRLNSNQKRLQISLAGMWMEFYLSIIATWVWIFASSGPFRSVIFFIASTSWIISLFINISPFLRFDGYYVLSDIWGIRNLQARSFEIARWWLRKFLFGFKEPLPEPMSRRQRIYMTTYAILTWLYRLTLYLGIAILVYHFFFKALGIALFFLELAYFIFIPIGREIIVWWQKRAEFNLNLNVALTLAAVALLLVLFFIPWQSKIHLPATMSYAEKRYYAGDRVQIDQVYVKQGDFVKKGQVLVKLYSGHIIFEMHKARFAIQRALAELSTSGQSDKSRDSRRIVQAQLKQQRLNYIKLKSQLEKLTIRADHSGKVAYLVPGLHHGLWIANRELLVIVVAPEQPIIVAFVPSKDAWRIQPGETADFIPDLLSLKKVTATVESVDYQDIQDLQDTQNIIKNSINRLDFIDTKTYHASTYGGAITVRDIEKKLIPDRSYYRILLRPIKPRALNHVERGSVLLKVETQSWAVRTWHFFVSTLIEEASF